MRERTYEEVVIHLLITCDGVGIQRVGRRSRTRSMERPDSGRTVSVSIRVLQKIMLNLRLKSERLWGKREASNRGNSLAKMSKAFCIQILKYRLIITVFNPLFSRHIGKIDFARMLPMSHVSLSDSGGSSLLNCIFIISKTLKCLR
jgi:hypothetical protein